MREKINDPDLASRIQQLCKDFKTPANLARLSGLAQITIDRLASGTVDPARTTLVAISKGTAVNLKWLATGEGPMYGGEETGAVNERTAEYTTAQDDYVLIPVMQGKISAGGGLVPDNNVEMSCAFQKNWIARIGDPKNMSMIRIRGDSMAPNLLDGDMVLVNHNIKAVSVDGGIYAITFQDEIMIKKIEVLFPSGQWNIRSDNPDYKSFIVDPTDVIINGKIIWFARNLER